MSFRDFIIVLLMVLIGGWLYITSIWIIVDLKERKEKETIRWDLKRLKDAAILFAIATIVVLHI